MYLTNCTILDITCVINILSRYTISYNKKHWKAINRVFVFLKATSDYVLHYSGNPEILEVNCDANWALTSTKVKSTSGYAFLLGGGALSWKFSKQTLIFRSTTEAEIIALDLTGAEAD